MLPALRIEIRGEVTASNLHEFRETALAAIRGVRRELSTDADFADAEASVKWCADVEDRLAAAKQHALSQTSTIEALFRTVDDISAEARRVRLDLSKLVTARKDAIRAEIIAEAQVALDFHVAALNKRLGANWIEKTRGPFSEAIKGKKTVSSCRDAASAALATAKIETSGLADLLAENRKALVSDDGTDWMFLFADFAQAGRELPETFLAIAARRIQKHDEDRSAQEARAQAARDAAAKAVATAAAPAPSPMQQHVREVTAQIVARINEPSPEPATLKLGDVCARLRLTFTAAFVTEVLGIPHVATNRSILYRESDFPRICAALIEHVRSVSEQRATA
jgi:hypothetical protein